MGAGTEYIYIHSSLRSRSNLRFQEVNILETGLRPDEIDTRISRPGSKEIDFTFKASPRLLTLNSNFFFFFFVNLQIVSKDVRRSLSIKDREGKGWRGTKRRGTTLASEGARYVGQLVKR